MSDTWTSSPSYESWASSTPTPDTWTTAVMEETWVSSTNPGTVFTTIITTGGGGAAQGVPVGGTTGQVIAKASGADYDTGWVDQFHPVQVFTPYLYIPLSVALVGGSVAGATLTVAALAGDGSRPLPVGRSIILAGDGANNGAYRALSEGATPGFSDGVLTFDPVLLQPFTARHVNKGIYSFNPFASLPFVGQVVPDGIGGYTVVQTAVPPVNAVGDVLTVIDSGAGLFYQWAAPASPEPPVFWPTPSYSIATKVLRADFTATGPTFNSTTGGWSTPAPGVAITTAGLDIRAMIRVELPVRADTGTTGMSDTFMEVLTQEHPTATGGDRFEAAILWTDSARSGVSPGRPYAFYEHLASGAGTETSNWADAHIDPFRWIALRWTLDIATSTVTMWRAVPYKSTSTSMKTADDGITWWPVWSQTFADAASIDGNNTLNWRIGKQATMSVAWLNARTFGNATANLVNVTAAGLNALTVGATSYTDTIGNVWTTTVGQVTTSPA